MSYWKRCWSAQAFREQVPPAARLGLPIGCLLVYGLPLLAWWVLS